MRLAHANNIVNWRGMADEIDERTLHEWMAFDAVEGLQDRRDDMRAAYFAALTLKAKGADLEPKDLAEYLLVFNDSDAVHPLKAIVKQHSIEVR